MPALPRTARDGSSAQPAGTMAALSDKAGNWIGPVLGQAGRMPPPAPRPAGEPCRARRSVGELRASRPLGNLRRRLAKRLDGKLPGRVAAHHAGDHRLGHVGIAQLGHRIPGACRIVMRVARAPHDFAAKSCGNFWISRSSASKPSMTLPCSHISSGSVLTG